MKRGCLLALGVYLPFLLGVVWFDNVSSCYTIHSPVKGLSTPLCLEQKEWIGIRREKKHTLATRRSLGWKTRVTRDSDVEMPTALFCAKDCFNPAYFLKVKFSKDFKGGLGSRAWNKILRLAQRLLV